MNLLAKQKESDRLGESQGQGSQWAAVYGVTQSRTRLVRHSSSSSSSSSGVYMLISNSLTIPAFPLPPGNGKSFSKSVSQFLFCK